MSDVVQHVSIATTITFTEAAKKHILSYLAKKTDSRGIRLAVKKTGCSGYSYDVQSVASPISTDLVFPLVEPYQLYVDKKSYPLLQGVQVDYIKQGLNYKFAFDNPNQTGQCGCGESFTIEKPDDN